MAVPCLSSQTVGTFCFSLLKPSVTTLWEAQATWKAHVDARINSPSWVKPSLHPGQGNGDLLQYSCLENLMDRGAWSMGSQSQTQWSN